MPLIKTSRKSSKQKSPFYELCDEFGFRCPSARNVEGQGLLEALGHHLLPDAPEEQLKNVVLNELRKQHHRYFNEETPFDEWISNLEHTLQFSLTDVQKIADLLQIQIQIWEIKKAKFSTYWATERQEDGLKYLVFDILFCNNKKVMYEKDRCRYRALLSDEKKREGKHIVDTYSDDIFESTLSEDLKAEYVPDFSPKGIAKRESSEVVRKRTARFDIEEKDDSENAITPSAIRKKRERMSTYAMIHNAESDDLPDQLELPFNSYESSIFLPHLKRKKRINYSRFWELDNDGLGEWVRSWKNPSDEFADFLESDVLCFTGLDLLYCVELRDVSNVKDVEIMAKVARVGEFDAKLFKLRLKLELFEVEKFKQTRPMQDQNFDTFSDWDGYRLKEWILSWPGKNEPLIQIMQNEIIPLTGCKLLKLNWSDLEQIAEFCKIKFSREDNIILRYRLNARLRHVQQYETMDKDKHETTKLLREFADVEGLVRQLNNWTQEGENYRKKMLKCYDEVQTEWKPRVQLLLWDMLDHEGAQTHLVRLKDDVHSLFLMNASNPDMKDADQIEKFRELLCIFFKENEETRTTRDFLSKIRKEYSISSRMKKKILLVDVVCWWIHHHDFCHFCLKDDRKLAISWLMQAEHELTHPSTKRKSKRAVRTLQDLHNRFETYACDNFSDISSQQSEHDNMRSSISQDGSIMTSGFSKGGSELSPIPTLTETLALDVRTESRTVEFEDPSEIAKYIHAVYMKSWTSLRSSELPQPIFGVLRGWPEVNSALDEITLRLLSPSCSKENIINIDMSDLLCTVHLQCGCDRSDAIVWKIDLHSPVPPPPFLVLGCQLLRISGERVSCSRFAHIGNMLHKINTEDKIVSFEFADRYTPNRHRLVSMGETIRIWIGSELMEHKDDRQEQILVFRQWYKIFESLLREHNNLDAAYQVMMSLTKNKTFDMLNKEFFVTSPTEALALVQQLKKWGPLIDTRKLRGKQTIAAMEQAILEKGGIPHIRSITTRIFDLFGLKKVLEKVRNNLDEGYNEIKRLHKMQEKSKSSNNIDEKDLDTNKLYYTKQKLERPDKTWEEIKKGLLESNSEFSNEVRSYICCDTSLSNPTNTKVWNGLIAFFITAEIFSNIYVNVFWWSATENWWSMLLTISISLSAICGAIVVYFFTDYSAVEISLENRPFNNSILDPNIFFSCIANFTGFGALVAYIRALVRGYDADPYVLNRDANVKLEFHRIATVIVYTQSIFSGCLKFYAQVLREKETHPTLRVVLMYCSIALSFINVLLRGFDNVYTSKRYVFTFSGCETGLQLTVVIMLVTDVYLRFIGIAHYLADVNTSRHEIAEYAMIVIAVLTMVWGLIELRTGSIPIGRFRWIMVPKWIVLSLTMIPHFSTIEPKYWLWEHMIRTLLSGLFPIVSRMISEDTMILESSRYIPVPVLLVNWMCLYVYVSCSQKIGITYSACCCCTLAHTHRGSANNTIHTAILKKNFDRSFMTNEESAYRYQRLEDSSEIPVELQSREHASINDGHLEFIASSESQENDDLRANPTNVSLQKRKKIRETKIKREAKCTTGSDADFFEG